MKDERITPIDGPRVGITPISAPSWAAPAGEARPASPSRYGTGRAQEVVDLVLMHLPHPQILPRLGIASIGRRRREAIRVGARRRAQALSLALRPVVARPALGRHAAGEAENGKAKADSWAWAREARCSRWEHGATCHCGRSDATPGKTYLRSRSLLSRRIACDCRPNLEASPPLSSRGRHGSCLRPPIEPRGTGPAAA